MQNPAEAGSVRVLRCLRFLAPAKSESGEAETEKGEGGGLRNRLCFSCCFDTEGHSEIARTGIAYFRHQQGDRTRGEKIGSESPNRKRSAKEFELLA